MLIDFSQIKEVKIPGMNDGTGVRLIEAGNAFHQRGLARAVYADQAHLLSLLKGEGHVL